MELYNLDNKTDQNMKIKKMYRLISHMSIIKILYKILVSFWRNVKNFVEKHSRDLNK